MTLRVLLVDDHVGVRQALQALLRYHPDLRIVGEAATGTESVEMAKALKPDLIVMDVRLPDINGIQAARRILANNSRVKIVILSIYVDRAIVRDALDSGVRGYVVKECLSREIMNAIRAVMEGKTFLSPKVAAVFNKNDVPTGQSVDAKSALAALSRRQREILRLTTAGIPAKTIASDLNVSVQSVYQQRQQIIDKLGVKSLTELIHYAIREGLLPPRPAVPPSDSNITAG